MVAYRNVLWLYLFSFILQSNEQSVGAIQILYDHNKNNENSANIWQWQDPWIYTENIIILKKFP